MRRTHHIFISFLIPFQTPVILDVWMKMICYLLCRFRLSFSACYIVPVMHDMCSHSFFHVLSVTFSSCSLLSVPFSMQSSSVPFSLYSLLVRYRQVIVFSHYHLYFAVINPSTFMKVLAIHASNLLLSTFSITPTITTSLQILKTKWNIFRKKFSLAYITSVVIYTVESIRRTHAKISFENYPPFLSSFTMSFYTINTRTLWKDKEMEDIPSRTF